MLNRQRLFNDQDARDENADNVMQESRFSDENVPGVRDEWEEQVQMDMAIHNENVMTADVIQESFMQNYATTLSLAS